MDYGRAIERAFAMSDATWARHANPWSGWTRVPIAPLLVLAIYGRIWLGWWCLVPIALLVAWAFINPRAFPPPHDDSAWVTRAVFGERIWLARKEQPIPSHHANAVNILMVLQLIGVAILIYGLVALDPWATIAGLGFAMIGKLWFCDRMVWLYEEVGDGRFTTRR